MIVSLQTAIMPPVNQLLDSSLGVTFRREVGVLSRTWRNNYFA